MPEHPPLPAVISIHDVMPRTLHNVQEILTLLNARRLHPVMLLVVPGTGWSDDDLCQLQQLQQRGCLLAGHGWYHHVKHIKGFKHTLHSRLISRNVAEHLALDSNGIVTLMQRCHQWFVDRQLNISELYVPPAWAMGAVKCRTLNQVPFSQFEYFGGVYDNKRSVYRRLPMVGFEADTDWRAFFVKRWNTFNLQRARRQQTPLRIAIHPHDLTLKLADELKILIDSPLRCLAYNELFA